MKWKTKSPQITSFEIPLEIYKAGLAISFLIYTSISSWYTGSQWEVGQWLFATVGYRRIKRIWVGTAIVHFFEASYALRLCLKHNSGFFVAVSRCIQVILFHVQTYFSVALLLRIYIRVWIQCSWSTAAENP